VVVAHNPLWIRKFIEIGVSWQFVDEHRPMHKTEYFERKMNLASKAPIQATVGYVFF